MSVSPAASQTANCTFEIYAGDHDPEPELLDDDATFGPRLGHWFNA